MSPLSMVACTGSSGTKSGAGGNSSGGVGLISGGAGSAGVGLVGGGGYGGAGMDFMGDKFLVSNARLPVVMQRASSNGAEWRSLMDVLQNRADRASAEDFAFAYLANGTASYCRTAYDKAKASMDETIVDAAGTFDPHNWYEVGDRLRPVALTLNWCGSQLSATEQTDMLDYMKKAVYRVWFDNGQGGWQIDDPGGNFHYAYLEATAYAGYSFRKAGRTADADMYLGILTDKITKTGGVLDYLTNGDGRGGDFNEGANYGQRSKQRMFMALAMIASQGGPNYFQMSQWFKEIIPFVVYQTQPKSMLAHPTANMARTGRQKVSSFDRFYVQLAVYHLEDSAERRLGQWFLENIAPDYNADFVDYGDMWMDVLYKESFTAEAPTNQPLAYVSKGTGLVFLRSGWDDNATGVAIDAFHNITYSHQHDSVGAFSITKSDFQAVDPQGSSYSGCGYGAGGLPDGENGVVATGADFAYINDPPGMGLTKFENVDSSHAYVQIDATGNNATRPSNTIIFLLSEWTREVVYLRPDSVVIYDRVAGGAHHNRIHFPGTLTAAAGGVYTSKFNGGAIAALPLGGGAVTTAADTTFGSSCPGQRLMVASTSANASHYVTALKVAMTNPPALSGTRIVSNNMQMEGITFDDQVVMFSANAKGAAPTLPLTYTVPGTGSHAHTVVNVTGSIDAQVSRSGGNTTITLSAGGSNMASDAGVIRFAD